VQGGSNLSGVNVLKYHFLMIWILQAANADGSGAANPISFHGKKRQQLEP
jgi:hypothetical protein